MQITQSYARPSTSQTDAQGTHFNFSQELSRRKPVSLHAMVNHSLAYAKLMLALRKVVTGDWRTPQRDHSRYQAWVQQEYLKELPKYYDGVAEKQLALVEQKTKIQTEIKELNARLKPLQQSIWGARSKYRSYLAKHEREKLWVLDPVISVHEDTVIFEAFSLDESSYGRVSVPMENLETFGEIAYGTTNIDFSQQLADEIYRVRSYRPAWLKVAYEQVEMSTGAGSQVEKKIDLPASWVQGFLQVQSASTLPGTQVTLSASTMNEIIGILQQKRAKVSPRSLRFQLKKGEKPTILIDPWGTEIKEMTHVYQGDMEGEVRIWGRRRLSVFEDVLPFAETIEIKLLGTGMPSYWSVSIDGHRFDVGLSGWTANDWAQKASFDLLASTGGDLDSTILEKAELLLENELILDAEKVANQMDVSKVKATNILQTLCRQGIAMYDHLNENYRWRKLLPEGVEIPKTEEEDRLKYANELLKNRKVMLVKKEQEKALLTKYFEIQGKNLLKSNITIDGDGRIKRAECSCGFFRHNKLRKGPCQHILAAALAN